MQTKTKTHRYTQLLSSIFVAALACSGQTVVRPAHANSEATTHYVAPGAACNGAIPCYATLQAAVDSAASGDTIKVAQGVYTGPGVQVVYITKSLALLGGYTLTNWSEANPQTNATIIDAQDQVGRRGIVAEGSAANFLDISIIGFTVRNGNNAPPQGCGGICAIYAVADIRSNTVLSNTGGGIYVVGGSSLGPDEKISTIAQNIVRYSSLDIFDKGGAGVVVEGANAVVQQNLLEFNRGRGIWSFQGSNARILNNTVRNNDGPGVFSGTSNRLWLDGNIISNNGSRGISLQADPPFAVGETVLTITNNLVQNNFNAGLNIVQGSATTGTIGNNTFSGNGFYGASMLVGEGSVLTLTQNAVTGNKNGGVSVDAGTNTTTIVQGNQIDSNIGSGVVVVGVQRGVVQISGNAIQRNKITNQFITDGGGGIRVEGGTVRIDHNRIANNSVNGFGGGIFIDGRLTPPTRLTQVQLNANLILTNTSLGLGSGIAIGGGIVTATNDIIARNYTELPAVYVFGGTLSANHWTIANNGSYGMRVFFGGVATISNTIVAGHSVAGFDQSAGGLLTANRILSWNNGVPCSGIATCTNVITGDPKFFSDRAINYHITAGSAAIDQAVDTGLTDDVDGPGRPSGSAPDIGADEIGNFTPTVNEVFVPVLQR